MAIDNTACYPALACGLLLLLSIIEFSQVPAVPNLPWFCFMMARNQYESSRNNTLHFDIYKKKDAGQCLPRDAAQTQPITAPRQLGDERAATDTTVSCAAQLWCPGGWGYTVYSRLVIPSSCHGFIAMWPHSSEVKSIYTFDEQLSMTILRSVQFRCDPKHQRCLVEGKT